MRRCLLVDFDGTLTRRDTTRILIYSLLHIRPWRLGLVIYGYLRKFFAKNDEEVQLWKNWCIGKLLHRLNRTQVSVALERYEQLVRPLVRQDLLDYFRERQALGDQVLIVTASFEDAVTKVFHRDCFPVLGTRFSYNQANFASETLQPECFSGGKVERVMKWIHESGENLVIAEAWSDSISDMPMMKMADQPVWVCRSTEIGCLVDALPGASVWNVN